MPHSHLLSKFSKKISLKKPYRGQAIVELLAIIIFFIIMVALIGTLVIYLYLQFTLVSAARAGARAAAVNPEYLTAPATAETDTKNRVISFLQQTTGQNIAADQITVTPPDPAGTPGQRDVTITVNFTMDNPIGGVATLLTNYGATGDLSYLQDIDMSATAIMRYEE